VEPEDANNLLIVVAGVGENPDENFIVMTIWLQKVQDEMGMVFSNENGEELTQMIYPLVFSVPAKAISSVLDAPAMHARMFVLQESTEKEEATDADKQTEAPVELEEVQQSV
jgi:hypothetical protein